MFFDLKFQRFWSKNVCNVETKNVLLQCAYDPNGPRTNSCMKQIIFNENT